MKEQSLSKHIFLWEFEDQDAQTMRDASHLASLINNWKQKHNNLIADTC